MIIPPHTTPPTLLEPVTPATLPEVSALYEAVHTALERGPNGPGWKRGIYPTPADALAGLEAGTLYVSRDERTRLTAATVILNHDQPEAYAGAPWGIEAPPERVMVVHTFMVHPDFLRQGWGERTLAAAHELARAQGCLCIRLDTYAENEPAKALYERMGYRRVAKIDLGYGEHGLPWYWAYELAL